MPSLPLLCTHNVRVVDGTFEKIVSSDSVSLENVSLRLGDAEKVSLSTHAMSVVRAMMANDRYVSVRFSIIVLLFLNVQSVGVGYPLSFLYNVHGRILLCET